MTRILVVAAHPDDEVLGAGGVMARHIALKDSVSTLILGEGITSRYADRSKVPEAELKHLYQSSHQALQLLGVKNRFYDCFPDNRFDSVDFLDIVKAVEKIIAQVKPSVIYTHFAGDLNIDHQITSRAVVTATRPIAGRTVQSIYAFEVPSATEWNFAHRGSPFQPRVFRDITPYLAKKLAALKKYQGEMRDSKHPRSIQGVTSLAQLRGAQSGFRAAEAFELIREVQ